MFAFLPTVLLIYAAIAGLLLVSYLTAACAGHGLIRLLAHGRYAPQRQWPAAPAAQLWSELGRSCAAILGIAALVTAAWLGGQQAYVEVEAHGWIYLAGSVVVLATVHDSYACLLRQVRAHRGLAPSLAHPSLLGIFALRPAEVLIASAWCLPLGWCLPLHPIALAAYAMLLAARQALVHLAHAYHWPGAAPGADGPAATALSLRA